MSAPRLFTALMAVALAATAGCDALELLVPELKSSRPSPRPSSPRYSQPLASPEAFAFQPRQWVPQVLIGDERLGYQSLMFTGLPAPAAPIGFLTGSGGGWLYRTQDGGASWTRVAIAATTDRPHVAMRFIDANTGWLATATQVFGTSNSGGTWELLSDFEPASLPGAPQPSPDPAHGRPITAMTFTSATTGFLLKGGRLFRTRDGGRTWAGEEIAGQPEPATMIAAVGDDVWAGGGGVSHHLPGQGWAAPTGKFRFDAAQSALAFVSATEGWALAQPIDAPFGAVPLFRTTDGGDSWTPHPLKDAAGEKLIGGDGPTVMAFSDQRTGWIAAGTTLFRTTDGGATWAVERSTKRAGIGQIQALAPLGPDAGWVVSNGMIYRLTELR